MCVEPLLTGLRLNPLTRIHLFDTIDMLCAGCAAVNASTRAAENSMTWNIHH